MCAAAAKGLAVRATAAKGLAAQATAAKGAGEWPEANACASVDLHPASHRGGSAAGGAGVRGAGGGRRGASAASTAGRALRLPLLVVAPSRPDGAASLRIRTSRGSSQVTSQSPARALTRRSAAAPCWWDPEGPDARVLQAEGTCSPHWSSTPSRTGGARKRVRHIAREASFGSRRQRNFRAAAAEASFVASATTRREISAASCGTSAPCVYTIAEFSQREAKRSLGSLSSPCASREYGLLEYELWCSPRAETVRYNVVSRPSTRSEDLY